jgi:hypothetical protein
VLKVNCLIVFMRAVLGTEASSEEAGAMSSSISPTEVKLEAALALLNSDQVLMDWDF